MIFVIKHVNDGGKTTFENNITEYLIFNAEIFFSEDKNKLL